MAQNTSPVYSRVPRCDFNSYLTAVNTTADLTAGTIYLVFTADATNGSYVSHIRFKATPAGNTTTTVARIWLNNGSSTGTATNNILFDEVDLPQTNSSATGATMGVAKNYELRLPASWRIYITLGTGSTNGWACSVLGGDY